MYISDEIIAEAERLLIGDNHFDDERRRFIRRLESCDLLAVPGSGKTTALQAKLYCLAQLRLQASTSGILVLSHTNAAIDEIKKKLSVTCPLLFNYPNFIGTIQDFVDSFLAIPFYNKTYCHSITRIDSRIYKEEFRNAILNKWIRGDSVWTWYKKSNIDQAMNFGIKLLEDNTTIPWNSSTNREFKVAATNPPKTWKGEEDQNRKHVLEILCELKRRMYEKGILNYDDCYVLAQMYINQFPRIKSILRKRFKYVFIDETQDLQDNQLFIMDQLFNEKTVCFQRIGDINQSIFHTGAESTNCLWTPRNVLTFNNSLRLSSTIASIVDPFMCRRENGLNVNGQRFVNQIIKPYLLVYDFMHKDLLKPQFVELIKLHKLNNIPEKKYGFHIIGWNSRWKDNKDHNPEEIRLTDIYSRVGSSDVSSDANAKSLADHVNFFYHLSDNKQRFSYVEITICECLRLCNKLDQKIVRGHLCNLPFTPTSFREFIVQNYNDLVSPYNLKILSILKHMVASRFNMVYEELKQMIDWLIDNTGATRTNEYLAFLNYPYTPIGVDARQDEHQIKIETIHCAKGQTHCATLYVETMYEGKYESAHVHNSVFKRATKKHPAIFCSNPFLKEIDIPQRTICSQTVMKMVYVGLSRPTHLLCYAMHKSSFDLYDANKLRKCGWQIIDLTN